MRYLVFPILIALAGCNAAENTTEAAAGDAGNAVESAGNAAAGMGESLANAASEGADALRNQFAEEGTDRDGWVGRWKGVEGTYLEIAKGAKPGNYKLEMQYTLDDKGSFDGLGTADGIAFLRPDGKRVLRASDGDATGLKYLAGKKDCLTVKSGEGYCRD